MAKTNTNKVKLEWLPPSVSEFWCKKNLEEIIPEKTVLLVQSGRKYLPQLVIEKTEHSVVSVAVCELEPSQLYRQPYKVRKAKSAFLFIMLGEDEGKGLVDKNSEEHKRYHEILRRLS